MSEMKNKFSSIIKVKNDGESFVNKIILENILISFIILISCLYA